MYTSYLGLKLWELGGILIVKGFEGGEWDWENCGEELLI